MLTLLKLIRKDLIRNPETGFTSYTSRPTEYVEFCLGIHKISTYIRTQIVSCLMSKIRKCNKYKILHLFLQHRHGLGAWLGPGSTALYVALIDTFCSRKFDQSQLTAASWKEM